MPRVIDRLMRYIEFKLNLIALLRFLGKKLTEMCYDSNDCRVSIMFFIDDNYRINEINMRVVRE